MRRWLGGLLLVALAGFGGISERLVAQAPAANVNELSLEVAALHVLHEMDPTVRQLSELIKLAHEVGAKPPSKEAKASPAYRKSLTELRTALALSQDEKIAELMEKLDQIHQKEEVELDNAIEITPIARERAHAAVQVLSVRQLAAFIGTLELADPVELLVDGFDQVRSQKENKDDEIDQLVEDVSAAAGEGKDAAAVQQIKDRVAALLKKASGLKDDEFKRQKATLEKQAREIVGKIDPVAALNRSVEHGMAEFLSNPRCEAALKSMRARRSVVSTPMPQTKGKKK